MVYGIKILLQSQITQLEHSKASNVLKQFVLSIEDLYGKEFCKFNTHLIHDFQRATKLFGALWDTSTFSAEHYNGVLARMFKNSQSVPEQICKSYNRFRKIEYESINTFSNPDCPTEIHDLYVKLLGSVKVSQTYIKEGALLRIFGAPKNHILSVIEKNVIQQLLEQDINSGSKLYYRFIYENILWYGNDQNDLQKRSNSCALLKNGNIVLIKIIAQVYTIDLVQKYVILANSYEVLERVNCITSDHVLRISSDEMFKICRLTQNIVALHPSEIQEKMICMPYDDSYCITKLVNHIEKD